jgi:hypothetical protein
LYDLAAALHPRANPSTADLTLCFGHLLMTASPHVRVNPFPVYLEWDSRNLMSVISAFCVPPCGPALFMRDRGLIGGLLMDATWKIIPVSIALILVLSVCHLGIPVMMAIGLKKTTPCLTHLALHKCCR